MGSVRIVTDSSCDLPPALAAEHGIDVVPLTVRFGDEEFVDRVELTAEEFWARCVSTGVVPQTAAPSPAAFEAAFRRAKDDGCAGVVCVTLSGDLSSTLSSAETAARQVAGEVPVRVVDSRSVTMALGSMCVSAARAAALGKAMDDVVAVVDDMVGRTRVYATLDTLENLRKGGRIGGAAALLGSMLSIKPVIAVVDGRVEKESRQRTRAKSLRYLADKVREAGSVENLAVVHGEAPDVDFLVDLLSHERPGHDVVVAHIGAVIGAHAGPRAVGVTFQLTA